jgi:hypothetical protein
MKAELKQKWIEALRSGKYQQAAGQLRNARNEFCGLGVLCDLVAPAEWQPFVSGVYQMRGWGRYMPPSVGEQTGLPDSLTVEPMWMNDRGRSFVEIADWIEANIPVESDSTGASES